MKVKRVKYFYKSNTLSLSLISKVFKLQSIKNLNDISQIIKELEEEFKKRTFASMTLRKTILHFFRIYNHLTLNKINEKYIQLSDYMIRNYAKENLVELVKIEIHNKSLWSFKIMNLSGIKLVKKKY